jgi:hypothetical protein
MEPDEYPFRYGRPDGALVWRDRVVASVAPPPVARAMRGIYCRTVGQPAVFNPVPNDQTREFSVHL